ncbi:MAG TPA: hypothetical protein VHV82_18920 [Sporichthyaceae bacterium]|jgi:hypothetical protein|nr:hypothetical protein [Sporichthyaceae bacterium]
MALNLSIVPRGKRPEGAIPTTAKFFCEEWCKHALVAENAATGEIIKRFKKPAEFNHVLALEVSDRPGVISHLKYEQGRCVAWTADLHPEEEVWARFTASLEA